MSDFMLQSNSNQSTLVPVRTNAEDADNIPGALINSSEVTTVLTDVHSSAQVRPVQPQSMRPYQNDCIVAIMAAWEHQITPDSDIGKRSAVKVARRKRALAQLATGAGKTSIFSELTVRTINPDKQRVIIIAHTQEIIHQIYTRIKNQFGNRLRPHYGPHFQPGIGIVMGSLNAWDARIIVATRQSLHGKRLSKILSAGPVAMALIDECHHVAAGNTYSDILRGLQDHNPDLKVAGFTATPKRTDGKALGAEFDEIVYSWSILDGIAGGFLVPITRIRVNTGVDLQKLKRVQGDYQQTDLVSVLDAGNWIDLAVRAYCDHIQKENRPCLAFFPAVAMSQQFAAKLNYQGIPAAHIDATTPREERADILRRYQSGELRVVSNMQVLTEGFDAPHTSAILFARPTLSEALLTQIIGRGLRTADGKIDCLMIDLTTVDTRALEFGSLTGAKTTCWKCNSEFYDGWDVCPHCGAALELPPEEDEEEEDEDEIKVPRERKTKIDTGEDLVAKEAELFAGLQASWHSDEHDWRSTGVGFDVGALFILPPTQPGGAYTSRIRERLQYGASLIEQIDLEDKPELLQQIQMLQRELMRCEQYTLYFVPKSGAVEFLEAAGDENTLMKRADLEALRRAGAKATKEVSKKAPWRRLPATAGQLTRLRFMPVVVPENCTRGQAANLITHTTLSPRVTQFIQSDYLPDPVGV